jgi:hypothetical protein
MPEGRAALLIPNRESRGVRHWLDSGLNVVVYIVIFVQAGEEGSKVNSRQLKAR